MTAANEINQDLLQTCKKAAEWLSGWGSAERYLAELQDAIAKAERMDPAFQEALRDMHSHQDAWRNAIQGMLHRCTGDEEYWRHELRAFNRTAFALADPTPASKCGLMPEIDGSTICRQCGYRTFDSEAACRRDPALLGESGGTAT